MLSMKDCEKGKELIERIQECRMLVVHEEELAAYINENFKFKEKLVTYNYANMEGKTREPKTDLDIWWTCFLAEIRSLEFVIQNCGMNNCRNIWMPIKEKEGR